MNNKDYNIRKIVFKIEKRTQPRPFLKSKSCERSFEIIGTNKNLQELLSDILYLINMKSTQKELQLAKATWNNNCSTGSPLQRTLQFAYGNATFALIQDET